MRQKPLQGFLGLQDSHAGKGSYVEYRNFRLQLGHQVENPSSPRVNWTSV